MQLISYNDVFSTLGNVELIDGYFASQFTVTLDAQLQLQWFMVLVALSYHQRQGHTCLDISLLAGQTLFRDEEEACKGWTFPDASTLQTLITQAISGCAHSQALRWEPQRLYTLRYWQFEQEITTALKAKINHIPLHDAHYERLHKIWPNLFNAPITHEQDWQQIATAAALAQRFTIINGGPGTGKTYTVTRLLLALQCAHQNTLSVQLAAPTGKAAQRMNESVTTALNQLNGTIPSDLLASISTDALTLHRLLGISRYGIDTRRSANSPLTCDVLIIDEASMVDMALMARVIRALPQNAILILVGDADQLPAVESGNVLEALITDDRNANVSPVLAGHLERLCPSLPAIDVSNTARDYVQTLQLSRRFSGDLSVVAQGVRDGNIDIARAAIRLVNEQDVAGLTTQQGVSQLSPAVFSDALSALAKQCFSAIGHSQTPQQALAAMLTCRWLTPTRRGPLGVEQLNLEVEKALNIGMAHSASRHYKGRPVMVTQNNYAQKLYNGDVGIIWPDDNQQLKAWFDTEHGLKAVSLSRLPAVETVYAMTVHKSQGSEFSHVFMIIPPPLSSQMASLNTRELLYTGLTRAKEGCTLVADDAQLTQVVNTRVQRHSGLSYMMAAG